MSPDGRPVLRFADAAAFDAWLELHHATVGGVWLKMARASSGVPSITWATAVPVALSHGWIDGQNRRVDDAWFIQKFTPRRPRSAWSRINVRHVERLIAEGRMRPWGLAEVERARADGRWAAAYPGSASAEVPEELARALAASPAASAAFATLDARNRFAMVYRVQAGRQPATRARNAAKFVAMLERGERVH